jgi:hypothetical protein
VVKAAAAALQEVLAQEVLAHSLLNQELLVHLDMDFQVEIAGQRR